MALARVVRTLWAVFLNLGAGLAESNHLLVDRFGVWLWWCLDLINGAAGDFFFKRCSRVGLLKPFELRGCRSHFGSR
jgi:hypothetical protein